jgi:hypothetical protein
VHTVLGKVHASQTSNFEDSKHSRINRWFLPKQCRQPACIIMVSHQLVDLHAPQLPLTSCCCGFRGSCSPLPLAFPIAAAAAAGCCMLWPQGVPLALLDLSLEPIAVAKSKRLGRELSIKVRLTSV